MHDTHGFLTRLFLDRIVSHASYDAEHFHQRIQKKPEKTVVYVMPSASILDYLILNTLALRLDLPLACFANDIPMLLFQKPADAWNALRSRVASLFSRPAFRAREESRYFIESVSSKKAVLVFLNKPSLFSRPARWNVLVWEEFIRAEKKERCSIRLLPISFIWGRRPSKISRTISDVLFGDTDSPGFFRKLFILMRHWNQLKVKVGEPIDVQEFLTNVRAPRIDIHAKKLRRVLQSYLFREKKLLAGPPIRSRERIIRTLLKDTELNQLVNGVARREKKTKKEIWKRAEKLLYQLISDYKPNFVALVHIAFRWMWNRLYERTYVDQLGLKKVKDVARDHPIVLVPSHKSHVDYMLLSAVFYENDMMPPHVAAGINLNFAFVGWIFRSTGAYFIRRRISGDLLYARLLSLYVRWLIKAGYSQEFFIEGGRTRTGKLVFPKHGLLSMQIDAFLSGACKDLYIVPIAITYERVPEDSSYSRELAGEKKEKENLWVVWRSRKLLKRRNGAAYVCFADPISVRSYLGVEDDLKISVKERKTKTLSLATEIIRQIAAHTMVTTTSLLSAALLSHTRGTVGKSDLRAELISLRNYLIEVNARLSSEVESLETHFERALAFFEKNNWISFVGTDEVEVSVQSDARINMDFYKNTVLHYFLPKSLSAAIRKRTNQENTDVSKSNLLLEIFAHEFFIPKTIPREDVNDDETELFAKLIRNYLESYDIAARFSMANRFRYPPSSETIRKVLEFGRTLHESGEIEHRESLSSANLKSAIAFFREKDLLKEVTALEEWHSELESVLR